MKQNRLTLLAILLLIWSLLQASDLSERVPRVAPDARAPVDTVFDRALTGMITATFRDQYQVALYTADSLLVTYPDHPAAYFFKAAILQGWMSTYRINDFQKAVEENVQLAIDKGNYQLEQNNDPWLHFYLGGAYGYRGFNRFRKLNFIGAYRDAQRGIDHFGKALEKDSTLYDVYLGLGSYYYWRTAKSKFLRIITFWMSDKRELGLDQLRFSIDHGRYAIYDAIYVLLAAYYDYGQYDKGLELVNRAIRQKESANLTDLYFKGRLLAAKEDWPAVQEIFSEILQRVQSSKYQSIGYQVEGKYWIARALKEENRYEEAFLLGPGGSGSEPFPHCG